jgi:hypothetical protein
MRCGILLSSLSYNIHPPAFTKGELRPSVHSTRAFNRSFPPPSPLLNSTMPRRNSPAGTA